MSAINDVQYLWLVYSSIHDAWFISGINDRFMSGIHDWFMSGIQGGVSGFIATVV